MHFVKILLRWRSGRLLPALALLVAMAQATTVEPPSFADLVGQADFVVDGEVSAVRSELVQEGGRRLVFTHVTIEVIETIVGLPPDPLELKVLGGTVGDFSVRVEGVPEFHVGDRDILFVVGNSRQFCPLVAIMHGLYPVVPRPGDDVDIVLRTSGEPLASPGDVQRPLAHGSHEPSVGSAHAVDGALTVDEFKISIREEAARGTTK